MASRTKKSVINSLVGISCSLVSSLLSFVLNSLFISLLGLEYAGVNSLFGGILAMLNIAELGVSNAVLYRLYRYIASNDKAHIELYLAFYKKVCLYVGGIVTIVGLCFIPFLGNFVKEQPNFPESLWSLYLIILMTSVFQHALDYRNILIIANQDRYIYSIVQYSTIFLRHGLQIVALIIYPDIYVYLVITLITTIANGVVSGIVSQRRYNLKWKSDLRVTENDRKQMTKDIGSLATFKFCRTLDATIDTFLISKFVDVGTTAIYGSVNMLLNALNEILGQFNDGMIASIGNLNAEGNKKSLENVYYQTFHFTYLVYGVCVIALSPFLNVFSQWWIGYTLSDSCIYLMLLNFLIYGFGMHTATFRNSMGIFVKGWKRPVYTALLNLLFSVLLVQYLGLIGTLLGTLIARLLTLSWYDPMLVVKHGWEGKPYKYYFRYLLYMLFIMLATSIVIRVSLYMSDANTFISLIWHGVVYAIMAIVLLLFSGWLIPEQKMLLQHMLIPFIHKFVKY